MSATAERTVDGLIDKLANERERSGLYRGLLGEAREWIERELREAEVELPDAEDLVARINQALPHRIR